MTRWASRTRRSGKCFVWRKRNGEGVDLYHFTRLLSENLSREQRLRLVEAIWGSSMRTDRFRKWRPSGAPDRGLLGFQHPEVQAVKARFRQSGIASP
jgi:hypothetical protein